MKIAFATTDDIHVNQHFGWCKEFSIYEIIDEEFHFIKKVDSSVEIEDEIDKLTYKIECLEESDVLVVQQIGPKASRMVQSCGVFPMQTSNENEKIEDILKKLIAMKQNPPIWMQRLLANEQQ
ncbi:MAG: NifB/NifX family molybdenum-iron cluster-binding protein [Arcobacteraceae bacterium]